MSSNRLAIVEPIDRKVADVQIERRSAKTLPYDVFVRDYVGKNRPVIITDAVPQWSALDRWTPEFFRKNFGDRIVDVTYGVKMRLAELIDAILASSPEKPGPYLHKVIIHHHMPELLPDLAPENIYGFPARYCSPLMPKRWQRPDGFLKLLIGGPGGKFPLMHYDTDNSNALITEIYGDKEFILFSPEDTPYIYPFADSRHTSQIENPDNPDTARFPLYARATQYRGTVHPNQAIFVPSGWWHSARVVTTSISVCTNMIHAANWSGFVNEACDEKISPNPASRFAKRVYLGIAGMVMGVAESIQKKFPGAGVSKSAASLSPISRTTVLRHLPH